MDENFKEKVICDVIENEVDNGLINDFGIIVMVCI